MNTTEKGIHLSGFDLKMIALITMLIDHTAASLLYEAILKVEYFHTMKWYNFYYFLRGVGRMAFPIYCFLIVEGFCYTRNRWKYAARMAIFAAISELPFDTALFQTWYDPEYNNVFFTLFLGILALMAFEWANCGKETESLPLVLRKLLRVAMVAILALIAEFLLCTDYGAIGVLTILIMYHFRFNKDLAFALGVLLLGFGSSTLEFAALLMLIPVHFYDGTRGRAVNKYVFYAFYPGHLTVLAVVAHMLGLGV